MASLSTTSEIISSEITENAETQKTAASSGTSSSGSKSLKSEIAGLVENLTDDIQSMQVACSNIKTEYTTSYLLKEKDSDALKSLMKEKLRRGFVGVSKDE